MQKVRGLLKISWKLWEDSGKMGLESDIDKTIAKDLRKKSGERDYFVKVLNIYVTF